MKDYDARLENWVKEPLFEEEAETILWGDIYDDRRQRWDDGTRIHTSGTPNHFMEEGDIIETRNTLYLLGVPA